MPIPLPFLKAKNRDEAFDMGVRYNAEPHGWIQFKGTELCMDVHCKCGELTHVDGSYIYMVECGKCGTKYAINGHVQFIEIEEVPEKDETMIKKSE